MTKEVELYYDLLAKHEKLEKAFRILLDSRIAAAYAMNASVTEVANLRYLHCTNAGLPEHNKKNEQD